MEEIIVSGVIDPAFNWDCVVYKEVRMEFSLAYALVPTYLRGKYNS